MEDTKENNAYRDAYIRGSKDVLLRKRQINPLRELLAEFQGSLSGTVDVKILPSDTDSESLLWTIFLPGDKVADIAVKSTCYELEYLHSKIACRGILLLRRALLDMLRNPDMH